LRKKCNFPNCLGTGDGKHAAMVLPLEAGSFFFYYKDYNSQVLVRTADSSSGNNFFQFGNQWSCI